MQIKGLPIYPAILNLSRYAILLLILLEIILRARLRASAFLSGILSGKLRIVSFDEPDARPIKKGKNHPKHSKSDFYFF